jgi:hypothetical protein
MIDLVWLEVYPEIRSMFGVFRCEVLTLTMLNSGKSLRAVVRAALMLLCATANAMRSDLRANWRSAFTKLSIFQVCHA